MQAEWWFEMSKSDSEGAESAEPASQILKERLRTLNESAVLMSRASVLKNGQMSRNSHPDFEFFLSRS
jgi:lipopolysaccharide biosynthesis protein